MSKFIVDISSDTQWRVPFRSRQWMGNFTTGEEEVAAACRAIRSVL